jgi:hypothetical protein
MLLHHVPSSFYSLFMEDMFHLRSIPCSWKNVAEFSVYLQLKDAAQLALKKMPSSEQEALSMVCDLHFTFMFCAYL